jgi:drug/metabolite transporter (DMT)-like permease
MNRRTALAFALIGLLWGSAWIPTTEILKEIPPLRAGALRFAIAAAFTGILAICGRLRPGKTPTRITAALFGNAFVLSVAALALPYALIAWAASHLSSAGIPALYALMPLVALLMTGESGTGAITALVIGIAGVVLLVAQGISFSLAQFGGVFVVLCAVVLGAFSLKYAKTHLRIPDLLLSSTIQFVSAAVLLGMASLIMERTQPPAPNPQAILWLPVLWLLALSIVISGITLPLLYWLLTRVEAWQAALLQWISTLVAVAEAALLLHARPTPEQAIGAACIVGAVLWLLTHGAPVTPPATIHTFPRPAASDSEVGSE